MNSERKNIFEQALQAVGGRLDRSITYDDSMSTEKDRNVLNSIMLKEKKIEYIHKQFDIYTDFLDKTDVSFGHYAAEISKSNQILFDENTHIYEKKAKLCKAVIIDHFYDDFDEYVENLPLDTDFNDINACRDFLPSLCKSDLNKKILDLCCESMTHGLRKRRLDIILDDLNRIEHTNKEQIPMKEISYSAFGQLRKYFNHANCHDSTPTELYHWYDMNFKSFKDEVLENLISIPTDGKIPYLEKLKNILEEDFSYLNPDRLELDALFIKHNTSEDEFLNHSISNVTADNFFNDYITSNRDYRNGILKLEVDEIHGVIFNYYGGVTKHKAIEFIDKQLKQIDPSHPLISEHKENIINSLDTVVDESIANTLDVSDDDKYNSYKSKLSILLLQYCEYTSLGNDDLDLVFIKSLGYVGDNCRTKGDYCPHCIYYWLKNKLGRELCLKAMPFNSYKDKLDFVLSHDELFDRLSTSMIVDDEIHFTTFPQNEEESDIYIPIAFELKEKENKERRINGQKDILGVPIVSFAELKCNLYKKALESADPKLLLNYEYNRILYLFPKGKKYGLESIFWYIHDLKVNPNKHIFNNDDDFKSIGFVEYGPLAEHYVNYYFYLKRIIDSSIQSFVDNLKYVSLDFIYFNTNSVVPLSQEKKQEILYSGKYIEQVCCLRPISFMTNIFKNTQITHDEYNIIFSVFTDHGFWDFGDLKFNQTNLDPNNAHMDELIHEIFSISESLFDCREHFLIEFKNLVIHENRHPDYTLSIARFKKHFQAKYDEIYIPTPKTDVIKLTPLDYLLKVVNKDDSFIVAEFGRLTEDRKYNDEGSWQNVNPFFVYSHISERYTKFKDYVFSELLRYQFPYDKRTFLLSIENKLTNISWLNITIEDVLNPYGISFIDLFEKTNNSLAIVREIMYDSNTILEIQRTKGKGEADRVYEQKFDVFHYILSYWRNKAIEFTRMKLSELLIYEQGITPNHDVENEELSFQKDALVVKPLTKGYHLVKGTTYDPTFGDFHAALKKFKFIEADLPEFRNAFHGNSGYNKIRWLKNQNELSYLINNLIKKSKIKKYRAWKHTYNIFKLKDEKSISPDIRTNSYNGEHASLNIIIDNL